MSRFIKIGEAVKLLGVSIQTMRRWELEGTLVPDCRSAGGTRYYHRDSILGVSQQETDLTVCYARVSSVDQKKDLQTQAERLAVYCDAKGWTFQIIQDLGSGMNYHKKV